MKKYFFIFFLMFLFSCYTRKNKIQINENCEYNVEQIFNYNTLEDIEEWETNLNYSDYKCFHKYDVDKIEFCYREKLKIMAKNINNAYKKKLYKYCPFHSYL